MANNGGKKVSPAITENVVNIPFVVSAGADEKIIFEGRQGSSFPALAGYILNNASSTDAFSIQLRFDEEPLGDPITTLPGDTLSFFAVGADNIVAVNTTTSAATGNLQFSINYNPL
ncbi:hypothetical protein SAMN05421736_101595 [Evansella caseinilytica]|uniref:Uncharacterized protein n=1 Tax=Evansella caseinilytica TaxID=1503961 RepID=A0A1H3HTX3_9BACI|nr:hypothetical protein [Evansella caseinilytica]SDY18204.1 hypothetical protein SAMN05421736_101595 [Evansella caseinilytica]